MTDGSLEMTDFTGAKLLGARLARASMTDTKLADANLTGADLSKTNLGRATFTNAVLAGAIVAESMLWDTTSRGFTQAQLASTTSYQAKDLRGIVLAGNDLTGWNFAGQNLTGAGFNGAQLAGANFAGAIVQNADFENGTSNGFTKEALYTTLSYQDHVIRGISLVRNDLTGWNFEGQDLSFASLGDSLFLNANLSGAVLRDSYLGYSIFSGAELSFADLRGAVNSPVARVRNIIMPDGSIRMLVLGAGDRMVIHDDDGVSNPPTQSLIKARPPIPLTIEEQLTVGVGSVLELRFDDDPWDSLISFQAGIPVQLGGTLELAFAKDVDASSQVGRTLDLFDWTGVAPTGDFTVSSLYDWDLSRLYTTGEVTLLAANGVIAGDANGDGKVDLGDFGTLKDHFGAAGSRAEGDANGDGKVDLTDFGLLKTNFGKSAAAVPEPATIVLAALGFLLVLVSDRGVRVAQAVAKIPRPQPRAYAFLGQEGAFSQRPGFALAAEGCRSLASG